MNNIKWQVIEDNHGHLSLAVFEDDEVIYFNNEYASCSGQLSHDLEALANGDSPYGWQGSDTPAADYAKATQNPHGWEIVADNNGMYPNCMGIAARTEFIGF